MKSGRRGEAARQSSACVWSVLGAHLLGPSSDKGPHEVTTGLTSGRDPTGCRLITAIRLVCVDVRVFVCVWVCVSVCVCGSVRGFLRVVDISL